MVDISAKPVSNREARAHGSVKMSPVALEAILRGNLPKGEVIGTARIAGIQAAKRTSELIPMCHPLALTMVDVVCRPDRALPGIRLESAGRVSSGLDIAFKAALVASVYFLMPAGSLAWIAWIRLSVLVRTSLKLLTCLAICGASPGAPDSDIASSIFC